MLILGIESSCDETAAAVVEDGRVVRSSFVASQDALHLPYQGVVPEIAARAHLAAVIPITDQALRVADVKSEALDGVAVTHVPGLIGALLIGLTAAKTLAWVYRKPLIGVNHLHAHIYSCALGRETPIFPCVSLVVSGGHTSLYYSMDELTHELMGATIDDAVGEAFDKVASILKLGYPGGPAIDKAAQKGNPRAVRFPRTRLGPQSLDFSFSGIKTAVLYHVEGQDRGKKGSGPFCARPGRPWRPGSGAHPGSRHKLDLTPFSEQETCDIAASFQEAVVDVVVAKTLAAVRLRDARRLAVGGGVARNSRLREKLAEACAKEEIELILPNPSYCVDNGAMVAGLGWHALRRGRVAGLDLDAFPRDVMSRRVGPPREKP
jgi:N6-L-threonylcarbamoyladenine synthase